MKYENYFKKGAFKKSTKARKKKGNWGTWEQRLWKIFDADHPFNN